MPNAQEFVKVIKENEGILFRITTIYCRDRDDQKDLYQEIVYQLWRSFDSFRHESKISTWLYRIALNTSISHLNKVKRKGNRISIDKVVLNIIDQPDTVMEERISLLYAQIHALNTIEPNAPVTVQRCSNALAAPLSPARAATIALGVMGGLGSILAVTGIFGIAMYNVSRRMKELGIRVALGARTRHVMNAALGRPIMLLGVGSMVGLLLSNLAGWLLDQIVYQANPRDPVVVIGAVLTMALLGIAASAIPALRALAVDPSKLLREE